MRELKTKYIERISAFREARKKIVYLDETWYDTHDVKKRGWSDGSAECSRKCPVSRGERVIILHTGTEDCFLENCLLISAKDIKQAAADYHQDMNSELLESWVTTQLLPALEKTYPGQQCVIVMDNAPYHSRLRTKSATSSTQKQVLDEIIQENIPVPQPIPP